MFRGFSPETMDFLWGIRMNNERSWFLAHKNDYMQYLYEPMKALGEAIFWPFQEVPGLELKVSRIYRGRENAPGHTVQGKSVDLHPPPGGYVEPASGPLF